MVEKAFNMLDRDGSGQITISDISKRSRQLRFIVGVYDVSMNPDFIEGRKTKEEILTEFLSNFEGAKGNKDGIITKEEFFDYYTDLSMSTPSDEYFVRMMESVWQMPEDANTETAKATVQHLLKEVKARAWQLAKNDQKLLRKVFSDFDLNQSGHLTIDEMTNMIAKLKISVERKYVYPFFKIVDANNSGGIEYDEFEDYMVNSSF